MIELNNVGMCFGEQVLFKDIDLQIAKGEKLAVIGPSGSGKSVLLKIMAGVIKPTWGKVLVAGQDLHELSESERQKILFKMGMLFQKNALFDSLTASENIAFPLREVTGLSENEIQERVSYFLNEVAVTQARELYPDEMSGGMQKRLGIARALALEPEIIFYDDPTAGLDPITSRLIVDLILRLQKEKNATVVAVTNDMNRAYQVADRIAMLVDGELIVTGNKEQTRTHSDARVFQFVRGHLEGPLTGEQ